MLPPALLLWYLNMEALAAVSLAATSFNSLIQQEA